MAATIQIRSDTCIRDDILLEVKWDPKISSDNDIAVAAVKKLKGVTGVTNKIEVRPKATAQQVSNVGNGHRKPGFLCDPQASVLPKDQRQVL
jgi:hypothetical protein